MNKKTQNKENQILIYKNKSGNYSVEVLLNDDTVWLTQDQMSKLFGKSKSTINEHIQNIYEENELVTNDTIRKFGISEFSTKPTNFYNLDVIISVGYRVKSQQGTQFRIRATRTLKEHLLKGFSLNQKRLAETGALDKNNHLYKDSGETIINDNALVALALLIAESEPKNKELMIGLIKNLLAEKK